MKQNENGQKFQDKVGETIKNAFSDDNIKEIDGKQLKILCDEEQNKILNGIFDDHRDFKDELLYKSYLVSQPFFNKIYDTEGKADWAYYSLAHSDGIMIEAFSHDDTGSKETRIIEDVINLLFCYSESHRILVIGGKQRNRLQQRAIRVFNNLKHSAPDDTDFSRIHIVVEEDLYSLLKSLETDKSVEIVLEEDAVINTKTDSKMVANS